MASPKLNLINAVSETIPMQLVAATAATGMRMSRARARRCGDGGGGMVMVMMVEVLVVTRCTESVLQCDARHAKTTTRWAKLGMTPELADQVRRGALRREVATVRS